MPLSIKIPENDISHLDQQARDQLLSSTEAFIDSILDEASRLEAAQSGQI